MITTETQWMKRMMRSLFAYHNLSNDNSYLEKYKERLGIERFNHVYDSFEKFLIENFEIKCGVYTDSEGGSYNSISKKI